MTDDRIVTLMLSLSPIAAATAAAYFLLGSKKTSVAFRTPTRMSDEVRGALDELALAELVIKEADPRGGVKFTGTDDVCAIARVYSETMPMEKMPNFPMVYKDPCVWLLAGSEAMCRRFAREQGVERKYWRRITQSRQLQGREGPLRIPDSRVRFFMLSGYEIVVDDPVELRAMARDRGFRDEHPPV